MIIEKDNKFTILNNNIDKLSAQWPNTTNQVPQFLYSPMSLRRDTAYQNSFGDPQTFDFPVAEIAETCYHDVQTHYYQFNQGIQDIGTGSLNTLQVTGSISYGTDEDGTNFVTIPNGAQLTLTNTPEVWTPGTYIELCFRAEAGSNYTNILSWMDGPTFANPELMFRLTPTGGLFVSHSGEYLTSNLRDGEWHVFKIFCGVTSKTIFMMDDYVFLQFNTAGVVSTKPCQTGYSLTAQDSFDVKYFIYKEAY